jgi:hypothetical protein
MCGVTWSGGAAPLFESETAAMSSTLAMSPPKAVPSIARQWIAAHIAAQLICLTVAAAAYGLATLVGANDPAAGALLKQAAFGLSIAVELIYAVAAAMLRGAVLRQVLPAFPMRLWVVAVAGYLMVFGLLSGLAGQNPAPVARGAAQIGGTLMLQGIAMCALLGLLMGLVVGTIEALVLRRAADGAICWALLTAVAWSAGITVVFVAGRVMLMAPGLSMNAMMALGALTKLVVAIVVAAITLPALRQLQPRLNPDPASAPA